jgi:hypothetical protein
MGMNPIQRQVANSHELVVAASPRRRPALGWSKHEALTLTGWRRCRDDKGRNLGFGTKDDRDSRWAPEALRRYLEQLIVIDQVFDGKLRTQALGPTWVIRGG